MRPDGSELPGWPVHTDALPLHIGHAFKSGELHAPVYGTMLASVAVGDLNHDGSQDVVGADFEGKVYDTTIPRNVRLSEAPSFGKPILLYDVASKGAKTYLDAAREFLQRHSRRVASA